jgi:hypothetical protein
MSSCVTVVVVGLRDVVVVVVVDVVVVVVGVMAVVVSMRRAYYLDCKHCMWCEFESKHRRYYTRHCHV